MTMPQAPIIITGAHRSGTSLVSRMLQTHGVDFGRDQEKNNESRFFLNINRWLLEQNGCRWDTLGAMDTLLNDQHLRELFAESIRTLLASHRRFGYFGTTTLLSRPSFFSIDTPWGWKDPRNTVTLPLWLSIFPDAKVLNITRHGVDVAQSLYVRNQRIIDRHLPLRNRDIIWISRRRQRVAKARSGLSAKCTSVDRAFDLWHEYMRASEHSLQQANNTLTVRYEDLLLAPRDQYEQIVEFCEVENHAVISTKPERLDATRAYAHEHKEDLLALAQSKRDILARYGY